MQINRAAPIPLYYQVKQFLLEKIESGTWPVGHVITSEIDLAKMLNVSRSTIRQAILELVQDGYLHRIQGKGTVVTEPKLTPMAALTSFSENMRAANIEPSYRTLEVKNVIAPLHIKNFFSLAESDTPNTLYIRRLLLANSQPLAIQQVYLPNYLFGENENQLSKNFLNTHSMYKYLEENCGISLWKAEEEIDAALPTPEEVKLLQIHSQQPILIIRRETYSRDETPVEHVKLAFRADRYHYRFTLFRTDFHRKEGE